MNFGSRAYKGGDRVIVRRRVEENKLAELKTAVSNNYHLTNVANWEESSSKLMLNKCEERKKLELEKEKKIDLEIRKKKLRKLLIEDEIEYKKEIDSKIETPLQRRERLEKQAKELRIKRIKRRQEFIEKQRLKQFREKCDELRLNNGHNLTMECHRIRNKQIKENELKNEYEKTLDNKYLKIWNEELQKKIDRENQEAENKKELNYETAKQIKKQIEENEYKIQQIKLNKQNEINQRVAKLNENEEFEKINNLKNMKEKQKKRNEIKKEYLEYQKKKLFRQQYEKQCDKEFIEKVLLNEQNENLQKEEKNKGNAKDIQNYLSYLNKLREKEKENEKLLEKLREKELEKEWNKKEMKWNKEELARKQLLQNVIHARKDQIAYKKCIQTKHEKNNTFQTQKIFKQLNEFKDKENKKKGDRLQYNKEIQQFLQTQIKEKQEREIENNKLQFDPNAEENQKIYDKLLKQETEKDTIVLQQGKSTHNYPKTTANWWTF